MVGPLVAGWLGGGGSDGVGMCGEVISGHRPGLLAIRYNMNCSPQNEREFLSSQLQHLINEGVQPQAQTFLHQYLQTAQVTLV